MQTVTVIILKNIFLQKVSNDEEHFEFDKSTLLFSLGGGIDFRKKIMESEKSKMNLLLSFNARYSMQDISSFPKTYCAVKIWKV